MIVTLSAEILAVPKVATCNITIFFVGILIAVDITAITILVLVTMKRISFWRQPMSISNLVIVDLIIIIISGFTKLIVIIIIAVVFKIRTQEAVVKYDGASEQRTQVLKRRNSAIRCDEVQKREVRSSNGEVQIDGALEHDQSLQRGRLDPSARHHAVLEIQLLQRRAARRKLPEDRAIEPRVGQLQDLEVAGDEGDAVQRRGESAMSGDMDNLRSALQSSHDPRVGIIIVEGLVVLVARAQVERDHGRRHVAEEEEAVHEVAELARRAVTAGGARADIDAGSGLPEVAPPPREEAGRHHLPRLEEGHDVVQERVREGAEAVRGLADGIGRLVGTAVRTQVPGVCPAHFVERVVSQIR